MPRSNGQGLQKTPAILTINDPHALRISRELAVEIGLEESIVLLQIEYLIRISTTEEHQGRLWTYQSIRDLQANHFPWWSRATIQRILKRLEAGGLIIIGNFNKAGYDRTQWFTLDESRISDLNSVFLRTVAISQFETSMSQIETWMSQIETTIPETDRRMRRKNGASLSLAPSAVLLKIFGNEYANNISSVQQADINKAVKDTEDWQAFLEHWSEVCVDEQSSITDYAPTANDLMVMYREDLDMRAAAQ